MDMLQNTQDHEADGADRAEVETAPASLFTPIRGGRALGRLLARQATPSADETLLGIAERLADAVSAARTKGYVAAELKCADDFETPAPEDAFFGEELEALLESGLLVRAPDVPEAQCDETPFHPFVTDGSRLYTERAFVEERECARLVLARLGAVPSVSPAPARLEAFMASRREAKTDPIQTAAVLNAARSGFAVIAGGPGTGKTTSVANLLSLFPVEQNGAPLRIRLMAPTGKAAARLTESLADALSEKAVEQHPLRADLRRLLLEDRLPSRTIDKWLLTRSTDGELPDAQHPMEADIIVVDEASMIDARTALRLLEAISPKTRLILLGDAHQLAAVGPGAVFAELTGPQAEAAYARALPDGKVVSRLVKSHRYPDDSQIHAVAEAIKAGDAEGLVAKLNRPQGVEPITLKAVLDEDARRKPGEPPVIVVEWQETTTDRKTSIAGLHAYAERALNPYVEAVRALLVRFEEDGFVSPDAPEWRTVVRALAFAKVLCATRTGAFGVDAVNRHLEGAVLKVLLREEKAEALLQQKPYLRRAQERMRKGRLPENYPGRVIIIRQNDERLGVANGDVGVVIPDVSGAPELVRLPTGADVPLHLLPAYDPAFALTIHQSQGSEFDRVAVVLPERAESPLAIRELLYTGVTRAKATVRIFGTRAALNASTARATVRISGLSERLAERAEDMFPKNR